MNYRKDFKPKSSIGERILRDLVKLKYPNEEFYYNYRPSWLFDPVRYTKYEIDIYIPYKGIAYEFNGRGHNYKNDIIKKKLCQKSKVELKYISCLDLIPFLEKIDCSDSERLEFKNKINKYLSGSYRQKIKYNYDSRHKKWRKNLKNNNKKWKKRKR